MKVICKDCTAKWYTQGKVYKVLSYCKEDQTITVIDDWDEVNTMHEEDFDIVDDSNKTEHFFEREGRYIVIKTKRLSYDQLGYLISNYKDHMVDSVVVEKDWKEYELVWDLIRNSVINTHSPKTQFQHYKPYFSTKWKKKIWLKDKGNEFFWHGVDGEGQEYLVYTSELLDIYGDWK